jgi:hypothetical protein
LKSHVGTVTQLLTSIETPFATLTIPPGTDVNAVPEDLERTLFAKTEGHYMFRVEQTKLVTGGIVLHP